MIVNFIEEDDPYLTFMDCEEEEFFDSEEGAEETKPQPKAKNFHLSLIYQSNVKGGTEEEPCFIKSTVVDDFLDNMDDNQLMGKSEKFNTLLHAMTTVEHIQHLEALQPHLAWKPIDVIKKTLENTTK